MKNGPLIASLRDRGITQEALASAILSSRSHVCQVLNNVPGRGSLTRKKLAPRLTTRELALLGWDAEGNLMTDPPAVVHVPRGKFQRVD